MPLYNEDGTEVEGALTKDEVEVKVNEGIETKTKEMAEEAQKQIDTEREESDVKMTKLEEDLEKANELIEKASGKDVNFKKLRESKEGIEKLLEEERTKTDEKIEGIKSEMASGKITSAIKAIIGSDQEKIDKAKFHFDHLKENSEDKDDWKNRIKRAVFLATGSDPKNVLNGSVISTGGGNPPGEGEGKEKFKDSGAKSVGSKLGLSDEEMKKAGAI